ncbi:hypothetical protein GF318_04990 [Candidatus Micrarchaeota archaeon]|nr:hypothetical protein [Candidatus Micrarchaeota archaeon]
MKNLFVVFAVLALLAVPAMAEDNATGNVSEANDSNATLADTNVTEEEVTLPGEFLYGFQRFFENVDKFFTLDKAEKAKKHARYGKLRAVEAHLMTKKAQKLAAQGDPGAANETLETVQELMEDQAEETEAARENLEEALDEGSADEEDVQEVEGQLRNSIVVLQRVYEKVPEPAKEGIARALNNSISNQERHEERMEEKVQERLNQTLGNITRGGPPPFVQAQNQTGPGNSQGKVPETVNATEATEQGKAHGKGNSEGNETGED